jgi:hypothetical protein
LLYVRRFLHAHTRKRGYPYLVGLTALAATLSFTIPTSAVVAIGVLLRREGWWWTAWICAFSSTAASLLILAFFRDLGWPELVARFPEFFATPAWGRAVVWITAYGPWALFAIAALPLPLTPALLFCALVADLPWTVVFLLVWAAKFGKYWVIGFAVSLFPRHFARLLGGRAPRS